MRRYNDDPELVAEDKKKKDTVYYETNIEFLKQHNGFRPGKVHVLLGTTSAGKSTMVKTIIKDFMENNIFDKVALWLSEETFEDFRVEMSDIKINHPKVETSLFVDGDMNHDLDLAKKESLIRLVEETKASLLVFDNLTTSSQYEGKRPEQQAYYTTFLKDLAKKYNVAILVITHTKAGVGAQLKRFIDHDDVRGSKAITMNADYLYIIQQFEIGEEKFSTLRIEKNRLYSNIKKLWYFKFNKESRLNENFVQLPFDLLKEKFKQVNRL